MTAFQAYFVAFHPQSGPEELPPLSPGIASVANLPGGVSVVRCRQTSESRVVRHLRAVGVPYYFPQQKKVRYIDGVRRGSYWRAFLPGYLFVADGLAGRQAAAEYGRHFANTVYGFLGLPNAEDHSLRRDLDRIERLLMRDPTLESIEGLKAGMEVTITRGFYRGFTAVVDSVEKHCRAFVNLRYFSRAVRLDISADDVERIGVN